MNVGIVDNGFGGLADAVASGDLPAGTAVSADKCASVDASDHGTAVAEVVHQMAPLATLHLYCVDDSVGLAAIESQIASTDKIVNSSLAFPGDARGDGTGATGSADATVEDLRKAGVLWVASAGNSGADHWTGTLADRNDDQLADLNGTADEDDAVFVPGTDHAGAAGGSADLLLQWDQWPVSSAPIALAAFGSECTDDACTNETELNNGQPIIAVQPANSAPVLDIPISNTTQYDQEWDVFVVVQPGFPSVRYDLNYLGDVSPSYYASQVSPGRAAAGSVMTPASSPYALAVGAADVGADGTVAGTLEPFSSQGPTIDGRIKPDITGWDGVSSSVYGSPAAGGGFFGTSAAAPHVAGAAALVASANPNLDAAQLQDFLQRRAQNGTPNTPPNNATGYGLLTLGAPTGVNAPAGARYTAVTPTRLLDTRTTTGGHHAPLGAGGTVTVAVPGLPADATAVAINLTGTGATGTTFMSAYPGGTAFPGTSNLNLGKTDPTAAVFSIVTVRNGAITIRNNAGSVDAIVDELGYFGTGDETGSYTALAQAERVLDTRTTTGGHHGKLLPGSPITVQPALPGDATAAIVNVTITGATGSGFVSAAPSCSADVSTLNLGRYDRANLAVVGLSGGTFCLLAGGHSTDVIVDVVGYLGASGAQYVALPAAQRIVDTRTGNGGYGNGKAKRPIGANSAAIFYGSNVGTVPAGATALFTGVTEADATTSGFLTVFPGRSVPTPLTSNLNYTKGRTVPNAVIAAVSGNQFGIYNATGSTDAVVDLFGYFVPGGS